MTYQTLDGLIRSHAAELEEISLLAYPLVGVSDFEIYTAKALDRSVDAAVAYYREAGLSPADASQETAPVAAILARGSLEVIVTIMALNRLGWSAFLLSIRLASHAYLRLLRETHCKDILSTESFRDSISAVREELEVNFVPLLGRKHHVNITAPRFVREYDPTMETQKTALIIHSSGSTGVPKPIYVTNSAALANFKKNEPLRTFCTSPLFHAHGVNGLFRAIYAKKPVYFSNFAFPATAKNLTEAMQVAKPELVLAVPYILKLLAESDEGILELAKARLVLYAGSACPEGVGDRLVAGGVNLATNYGSTETGYLMNSRRPAGDDDWNYLRLQPPFAEHVIMDEISPGLFECVALSTLPSLSISNSDDPPNSFRTRDLFVPHPDISKTNMWKYVSRLDDRVTLINGEKVLPGPIESHIRQHAFVEEVAVFGIGRAIPGAIIFRSVNAAFLTDDQYIEAVWPTIKSANAAAESFSTIPRELVVVLPPETPYPQTPKGTIVREQLYQEFAGTIDEAYERFENGNSGVISLNIDELQSFILERFRNELGANLKSVDTDIFAAGIDSLQTLRMWAIIKKELDLGGRQSELSRNVVFEKGNVRELAKHLFALRTSTEAEQVSEIDSMRELIQKYSSFNKHVGRTPSHDGKDTVLLTGATGNLGAFVLVGLVKLEHISHVWALVRAPDAATALSRVHASLKSRNLNLSDHEFSKIIALRSDLSMPDLGLPEQELQKLLSTMTCAIHCAWAVNFNIPVRSFEAQHIAGLYNIINICLSTHQATPASLVFCSSLSVAGGTPKPARIAETVVQNLNHAQGMGYARSKLVAEHIVSNAMRSTDMKARTLRIGQIVGDGLTGTWNETEAVPLMIRSAITTGALPMLNESPSWLPVDTCSQAILDLAFPRDCNTRLNDDPDLVYHIINKDTFDWTKDLLPALRTSGLCDFEAVTAGRWLDLLRQSDPDPTKNPSIKLLEFWERKYGQKKATPSNSKGQNGSHGAEEDTSGLVFEMDRSVRDCPTLKHVPDLISGKYIQKFVDGWLQKWV